MNIMSILSLILLVVIGFIGYCVYTDYDSCQFDPTCYWKKMKKRLGMK